MARRTPGPVAPERGPIGRGRKFPMRRSLVALAAGLGVASAVECSRPVAAVAASRYSIHAEIRPPRMKLGERVLYRGWVVVPHSESVRWITPRSEGAFSWGTAVLRRIPGADGASDTVRVEAPLQVFALGRVSVPGLRLRLPSSEPANPPREHALPVARLWVAAQIAPQDTAAELRPVRGPVAAPWWERIPWTFMLAGVMLIAAIVALIAWRKRRRPVVAPPVARVAAVRRDPTAEALAALTALRRLQLPESGRFGEHAFQLTRIVRHYLEATAGGIRPGFTTSELVAMLSGDAARLDLTRLEGLLRLWDFIKFARGSSTVEEARSAEDGVEALLRSASGSPQREVA